MNENTFPLYPKSTLFKALVSAMIVATVLFVTVILPTQYQTDPTGVGAMLGLDQLNPQKTVTPTTQSPSPQATQPPWSVMPLESVIQANNKKVTTVTIPPQKGIEYKVNMQKHAQMDYKWTSNGDALFVDFHGEPKGDTTGYFKSYTVTTAKKVKGAITVPFDGIHGWYWKNNSSKTITVSLEIEGAFQTIGLMH
jgi:hypothetical protein